MLTLGAAAAAIVCVAVAGAPSPLVVPRGSSVDSEPASA